MLPTRGQTTPKLAACEHRNLLAQTKLSISQVRDHLRMHDLPIAPRPDERSEWLLDRRHGGDAAWHEPIRGEAERFVDRLLDFAQLGPDMTLADVGCGDGRRRVSRHRASRPFTEGDHVGHLCASSPPHPCGGDQARCRGSVRVCSLFGGETRGHRQRLRRHRHDASGAGLRSRQDRGSS
jgi:hypothetical protein